MRALVRAVLLLGCAEFVPLLRCRLGFLFGLLLALVIVVKQQALVALVVTEYYQRLHEYALFLLALSLVGRFLSRRMWMHTRGVALQDSGTPWLCFFGIPQRAARCVGEPLLVLAFAVLAAGSDVLPVFQPSLAWREVAEMIEGLGFPFGGLQDNAEATAYALPVVAACTLALMNWLGVERQAPMPGLEEKPLTFSVVRLPSVRRRLQVPSAARMALDLHYAQKKGKTV